MSDAPIDGQVLLESRFGTFVVAERVRPYLDLWKQSWSRAEEVVTDPVAWWPLPK